jgi:hypothetical protein
LHSNQFLELLYSMWSHNSKLLLSSLPMVNYCHSLVQEDAPYLDCSTRVN